MAKIKVIRIIDRLNIGGPGIHVVLLTKGLDKEKFETILIAGKVDKDEGDMSYFAKEWGVEPLFIPELGRRISLFSDWIAFWKILKILLREKPNIVHTHKSKAGAIGRLAAWIAGVPIIIHTFHGHVFHGYFGKGKTWLFLMIERILAKWTRKIIVLSPLQLQEISRKFRIAHPSKMIVIPLGFDFSPFLEMEKYKGRLRQEWNIKEEEIVVGIVARLCPIKNHAMFLKAARLVLNHTDKIKFVIIGDGELKQELVSMTKELQLSDHVVFTGWIYCPAAIYADLDIVALTSLNEGTPVTIIEAMFCKKPVIATLVGGVPDLIVHEQTGFLVKPNDIECFASLLLTLAHDPQKRKEMGEAGYTKIHEKYSHQRLMRDIENLYSSKGIL